MTDNNEQGLLAAEEARRQAMLDNDIARLEALLADGLAYVHSTGGTDSKQSYLKKLSGGDLLYETVEFVSPSARVIGTVGLVSAAMRATVTGRDGSKPPQCVQHLPGGVGAWPVRLGAANAAGHARCASGRMSTLASPDAELVRKLALANRILYARGVVDGFGHVSVRHNSDPGVLSAVTQPGAGAGRGQRYRLLQPGRRAADAGRRKPIPGALHSQRNLPCAARGHVGRAQPTRPA